MNQQLFLIRGELNIANQFITSLKNYFENNPLTEDEINRVIIFDCSKNEIDNFEGLPNFKYLEKLCFEDNKIKSFEGLRNFPNLRELWCSHNEIESFIGLNFMSFPNLWMLDCSINKIKNLSMDSFPNLHFLNCSHNRIESFMGLSSTYLHKLQTFNCSCNEIESFIGLNSTNIPNLLNFDCSYNKIKNFIGFPNFSKLRYLTYFSSFFENKEIYRNKTPQEIYRMTQILLKCSNTIKEMKMKNLFKKFVNKELYL